MVRQRRIFLLLLYECRLQQSLWLRHAEEFARRPDGFEIALVVALQWCIEDCDQWVVEVVLGFP